MFWFVGVLSGELLGLDLCVTFGGDLRVRSPRVAVWAYDHTRGRGTDVCVVARSAYYLHVSVCAPQLSGRSIDLEHQP